MPLTSKDVEFAARALALKRTVRKGWTRVPDLKDPESVADHSFGVTVLALLATARDPTLDAERALTIAVAHDLAEAVTGDLVPGDYADAEEKRGREDRGMQTLLGDLDPPARRVIEDAWREYEDADTPEAQLVRELDKVEMALQGRTYAREGADPDALTEFWESALGHVDDARLKDRLLKDLPPREHA